MADLAFPVDRAALLLVEMQHDIVHESNVGEHGLGGVLAMQVRKRGVIPKLQALAAAARARDVPVLYGLSERSPWGGCPSGGRALRGR